MRLVGQDIEAKGFSSLNLAGERSKHIDIPTKELFVTYSLLTCIRISTGEEVNEDDMHAATAEDGVTKCVCDLVSFISKY